MDTSVQLVLEELLAWRQLDVWRRKNGLREMYPHLGFLGSQPIVGCECHTCVNKWYLTDKERVEKHNNKIEMPLKSEFIKKWTDKNGTTAGVEWNWRQQYGAIKDKQKAQSVKRAEIIRNVLTILGNPREEWADLLASMLSKENEDSKDCMRKIMKMLVELLNEETTRNKLVKNWRPYSEYDWGLRTLIPKVIPVRKQWNGRFYIAE